MNFLNFPTLENRWDTRVFRGWNDDSVSHQWFRGYCVRCFFISLVLGLSGAAYAADLTIFAAASLKEALDENVKAFNLKTGHQVRVSYGGSNTLARQIENGAPADLFISADAEWMDYVAQKNLISAGTRRDLVTNSLVLIAPADSRINLKIAPKFALAQALQGGRFALANPDAVPAGKYDYQSGTAARTVWSKYGFGIR